jgi:hypothetical protein
LRFFSLFLQPASDLQINPPSAHWPEPTAVDRRDGLESSVIWLVLRDARRNVLAAGMLKKAAQLPKSR